MCRRSLRLVSSHVAARTLAAAFVAVPLGLSAEPLDKEACDKLQAEKQTLVVLGVDKEFAKGPEWAKANLKPAELNLIKRYLTIDETLKFRCGMAVAALVLPDDIDETLADLPGAVLPPPMPVKRGDAMAAPAAAPVTAGASALPKPTAPAAKAPPTTVKPTAPQSSAGAARPAAARPPAAAPAKPAPKPVPAKPQSSWNTEMEPVESAQPATFAPQPRVRKVETGD